MGPQTEADRESSHPCAPDLAGSLLEAGRGSRKCLAGGGVRGSVRYGGLPATKAGCCYTDSQNSCLSWAVARPEVAGDRPAMVPQGLASVRSRRGSSGATVTTGDAGDGLLGLRTASCVTDMCSHHVLTLTCTLHIRTNVQEEQMFKKKNEAWRHGTWAKQQVQGEKPEANCVWCHSPFDPNE